jgi:hypothetical protein
MRTALVFLLVFPFCAPAPGQSPERRGDVIAPADTTCVGTGEGASGQKHRIWLDIFLGGQFFPGGWSPYQRTKMLVGVGGQVRPWSLPFWLDGAIIVAFAGETDAEGNAGGPGASFVELHNGIGYQWHLRDFPVSFYLGGGLTYSWARLELEDASQPPLPISGFLGRAVYPDRRTEGHFWGGYLRGGAVCRIGKEWFVGVVGLAMLTTSRNMLDRQLNLNSSMIALAVGVEE